MLLWFDPKNLIEGLNDSKKLTQKKRAELFPKIVEIAVDYELIRITPKEVDSLNVFQARMEVFTTLTFHNIIYTIQSYSFVKKIRLLFDLFFLFYKIKKKVLTWLIIYKMKKLKY